MYYELQRLARHQLRNQRPNHTLQTTGLVHEAFLRLAEQNSLHVKDRAHFLGIAAQLLRWILVLRSVKPKSMLSKSLWSHAVCAIHGEVVAAKTITAKSHVKHEFSDVMWLSSCPPLSVFFYRAGR